MRIPVFTLSSLLCLGCGDSEGNDPTGSGGTGGAVTSSGTSTSTSTSTDTGGSGTSTSTSTQTGTDSGPPPSCATADFILCEGFEDADDGAFPTDWGPRGDEWGEGVIGVASDDAMRGTKSLKVDGGNNGQHFMDYKGDLGELASHHYGRVFMKVAVPAPWPSEGVLHADFIEGLGPGPNGGTHNLRWGIVENPQMMFQWIYNVQPSNAQEWAEGTAYRYTWTGAWQCIEWMYDEPSQSGKLWIDGVELPIVPGANHPAEIPVFTSLGVGLANYQDAGDGFTVWFDELALHDGPIGCEN